MCRFHMAVDLLKISHEFKKREKKKMDVSIFQMTFIHM